MMILFLLLIILLVYLFLQNNSIKTNFPKFYHKQSPVEILKAQYAKGEISKEEYEEKKKDLE